LNAEGFREIPGNLRHPFISICDVHNILKILWPILTSIVIIGIGFTWYDSNVDYTVPENTETSISTITTLQPVTSKIIPTTTDITSESFKTSSVTQKIDPPVYSQNYKKYAVYALSPTDNELSFLSYTKDNGNRATFDSNHNVFTWGNEPTTVSRIDISTNETKTWTIPNDGLSRGTVGVDSQDFGYFLIDDTGGQKIAKLDHITNNFTTWRFAANTPSKFIFNSTNDVISFSCCQLYVGKLSENIQIRYEIDSPWGDYLESTNTVYVNGENIIQKIDLDTNEMIQWSLPHGWQGMGLGLESEEIIWFTEENNVRAKLAKLNTTSNELEEWVIPRSGTPVSSVIVIDDSGIVYLNNPFTRFNPQTGEFTFWDIGSAHVMEFDNSGNLWIIVGSSFGKLSN
jgi:streptogramin lyase